MFHNRKPSPEEQYLSACLNIIREGVEVKNKRTNVNCITKINVDLIYGGEYVPILTTKKCAWKSAIAELLGYLKGYDSAKQFREEGTNTWNANANENESWLKNPYRKGEDDMGRVYGVQGRKWIKKHTYNPVSGTCVETLDQLEKIVNDLKLGIDDRGEILTFWNPGEFDKGCLRPCMHTYQFSILGDSLHLHISQRSGDMPLGVPFNMIQGYTMLLIMSNLSNLKMGNVYHRIANAHIYENQIDIMKDVQLRRLPLQPKSELILNKNINSLNDIENLTVNDFELTHYDCHDAIEYPFSV